MDSTDESAAHPARDAREAAGGEWVTEGPAPFARRLGLGRQARSRMAGRCRPPPRLRERIGQLTHGRHREWGKDEPNGPAEMAEAVRVHGLPWFDRVRSVEDQAAQWYGRYWDKSPWRNTRLPELAVTLYRLGLM